MLIWITKPPFTALLRIWDNSSHFVDELVICTDRSTSSWWQVSDEMTYPFPNFNGASFEVWEWWIISFHTLPGLWLLIQASVALWTDSLIESLVLRYFQVTPKLLNIFSINFSTAPVHASHPFGHHTAVTCFSCGYISSLLNDYTYPVIRDLESMENSDSPLRALMAQPEFKEMMLSTFLFSQGVTHVCPYQPVERKHKIPIIDLDHTPLSEV